jgi:hypothetical protein
MMIEVADGVGVATITVGGIEWIDYLGTVFGTFSHEIITFPVVNGTIYVVGKLVGMYEVGITTGDYQLVGTATTVIGVEMILLVGTVITVLTVVGTRTEGITITCGLVGSVRTYVVGKLLI